MDHTMEWHHGSPTSFKRPGEPEDNEDDEEYDPDDRPERHWNTHLGTHWTSLPEVAKKFADGLYEKKRSARSVSWSRGLFTPPTSPSRNPRNTFLNTTWTRRRSGTPGITTSFLILTRRLVTPTIGRTLMCLLLRARRRPGHTTRLSPGGSPVVEWAPNSSNIAMDFKDHLQRQGHDGVVYGNEHEGPLLHDCAITFDPSSTTTSAVVWLMSLTGSSSNCSTVRPYQVGYSGPRTTGSFLHR